MKARVSVGLSDLLAPDAERALGRAQSRQLVRWGACLLVLLLLPAAVTDARDALTKPFWADEILTATVAGLGSPRAIWDALMHVADAQPPLFHIVTAFGTRLVGDEHLAYRLPGLVGFYCVPFCLYFFVARRVGPLAGLAAALTPVLSGLQPYAVEARPYGWEVGCFALALLFWQKLEDSRWFSVPFGVCLAVAVASHYYAVLVLPAFAVAEGLRSYRIRQLRYHAWAAIVASVVPLFIAWPLIASARSAYGGHYWAGRSLLALGVSYSNLTRLSIFTAGAIVVLSAMTLIGTLRPWLSKFTWLQDRRWAPPEEHAFLAYLLVLPLVTFVAAILTNGGILTRYVLPMAIGLGGAAGFLVARLGRTTTTALLCVLVVSLGFSSLVRARTVFHARSSSAVENSSLPEVEQILRDFPSSGPLVVSSGTDYLPLAYYARPEDRDRIVMLLDTDGALEALGTDSVDLTVLGLKPYLPLNLQDYATFCRTHRRFLLFSSNTPWDWWPGRLSRDGHRLTLRQIRGDDRLYEVELRP